MFKTTEDRHTDQRNRKHDLTRNESSKEQIEKSLQHVEVKSDVQPDFPTEIWSQLQKTELNGSKHL